MELVQYADGLPFRDYTDHDQPGSDLWGIEFEINFPEGKVSKES